jgi:pilus assembly protein FimV
MPDFEDDDDLLDEAPAPVAAVADTGDDDPASETSDVIGEADIYIAYGRYPQAIGLLLGVLEEDPGRNDVRLKLLELYAETRDREAFESHLAELVARCNDEEALLAARELESQFGDEGTNGAAAPGAGDSREDEIDLDGLAVDDAAAAEELDLGAVEPPKGDASLAADDFELELDELVDEPPARRKAAGEALGGDLGIDFDPGRSNGRAATHSAGADADDELGADEDLDLDLDLDDADVLGDEEFDLADEGDTASTKLDLARAYIDMGDQDGARDILNEVVAEGTAEQKQRATAMLEEL